VRREVLQFGHYQLGRGQRACPTWIAPMFAKPAALAGQPVTTTQKILRPTSAILITHHPPPGGQKRLLTSPLLDDIYTLVHVKKKQKRPVPLRRDLARIGPSTSNAAPARRPCSFHVLPDRRRSLSPCTGRVHARRTPAPSSATTEKGQKQLVLSSHFPPFPFFHLTRTAVLRPAITYLTWLKSHKNCKYRNL
jgi:hypothetical protein